MLSTCGAPQKQRGLRFYRNPLIFLAGPAGLEPAPSGVTEGLDGCNSLILLNANNGEVCLSCLETHPIRTRLQGFAKLVKNC